MSQKIKLRAVVEYKYEADPIYYTEGDQSPEEVTVEQMIRTDEDNGPGIILESSEIMNHGEDCEFFVLKDNRLSVKDSLQAIEQIREMCADELIHPGFRAILAFRIGDHQLGRTLFDQNSSKYAQPPEYYLQYERAKIELDRLKDKLIDLKKFVSELSEKFPANLELKRILKFMGDMIDVD